MVSAFFTNESSYIAMGQGPSALCVKWPLMRHIWCNPHPPSIWEHGAKTKNMLRADSHGVANQLDTFHHISLARDMRDKEVSCMRISSNIKEATHSMGLEQYVGLQPTAPWWWLARGGPSIWCAPTKKSTITNVQRGFKKWNIGIPYVKGSFGALLPNNY